MEEPQRLNLRGRRPPPGHVCPSDVNVRWFIDHLMHRQVRQMDESTLADMHEQLGSMSCLSCDNRLHEARLISAAVTPTEIISGISRYSLS